MAAVRSVCITYGAKTRNANHKLKRLEPMASAAFLSFLRRLLGAWVRSLLPAPLAQRARKERVSAFCIGFNYSQREHSGIPILRPCCDGAKKIGFRMAELGAQRVSILIDDASASGVLESSEDTPCDSCVTCTRASTDGRELENSIAAFITGSVIGDSTSDVALLIAFCGHGTRVRDDENEEYHECIVTPNGVDYLTNAALNLCVARALRARAGRELSLLVFMFDSCHSGTQLDLQFTYRAEKDEWVDTHTNTSVAPAPFCAMPGSPVVVCFSACTATGDAHEILQQGQSFGLFSRAILRNLWCLNTSVLECYRRVRLDVMGCPGLHQVPMLCSSQPFQADLCFDGRASAPFPLASSSSVDASSVDASSAASSSAASFS